MIKSESILDADAMTAALARFGLDHFRPGQSEVIECLLSGRDVLCVMPTGGGKSLCYQLPSVLLNGVTVVVSPLIALMKDQEDQLLRLGHRVAAIHSGLEVAEQRERLQRIEQGQVDICYIAPERLRSQRFLDTLTRAGIALLAVDEAHCISEWGHDFRPDYARLGWFRQKLGWPRTIALTATATDVVRRDIVEQLQLADPAVFVRGFDRPNLRYGVQLVRTKAEKLASVEALHEKIPGSKVIYTASRKACEEVTEFLRQRCSHRVALYHAGLMPADRRASQEAFMSGEADIIVATNAFGMGVDKPDIRAVIHYNLPGTLEAYYQEAGRAGRDGKPARCELLFSPSDRHIQEFFIEGEYPDRSLVMKVLTFMRSQPEEIVELTRSEIKERVGGQVSEMAIGASLKILESAGVLERLRSRENMAIIRIHETGPDLGDLVPSSAKTQQRVIRHLDRLVGKHRGEDFYFHPNNVADELGIERSALTHALRELAERLSIEYIPPFRGSATRIVDRATSAEEIPIDFDLLHRQKLREFEKLDRMIAYAQGFGCRRSAILSYFGDKGQPCGRCDVCEAQGLSGDVASQSPTASAVEGLDGVVEVVLTAVDEVSGRVGKTTLAAALAGSSSQKCLRFARCSWYGALDRCRQSDLVDLLHALQAVGAVDQAGDKLRPTVAVAPLGQAILSGGAPIPAHMPLGPAVAESIRSKAGRILRSADGPPAREASSAGDSLDEEAEWTCRLLDCGFSLTECAAIRRWDIQTILDHLLHATKVGRTFPRSSLESVTLEGGAENKRQRLLDAGPIDPGD